MKRLILGLMLACGSIGSHNDECFVCSGHQYEFQGAMNNSKTKEKFWRTEERVCEKQFLSGKAKEGVAPRLDKEFSNENEKLNSPEQPKSKAKQKLEALKQASKRLSGKR